jgi:phosphatidylglycerol:prolipoprotein diacylglycerol transferase
MRQVLFWIPTPWFDIPVYGFGMMLFVAFVVCTWLAGKRAAREGVEPRHVQDMAIWIFLGGIIGARIVWMIQFRDQLEPGLIPLILQFFEIWKGGLVFYGSAIGGLAGYLLFYRLVLRRQGISSWRMADIVAPSAALGLCLGRIGCLLNGCCYGNVACPDCLAIDFPSHSPPFAMLVERGYQSAAGFVLADDDLRTVAAVAADSPAADAGLHAGDVIVAVDGQLVPDYPSLWRRIAGEWPRGKTDLTLTVRRGGQERVIGPFAPRSLGLHPTQVYESISTFLLFLLLTAFYPFRRRDGEVMVLFMLGYAVHRFLNEVLRNDTEPVGFGMTLSQNGSILVFVAGLMLMLWLRRQPTQYQPQTA